MLLAGLLLLPQLSQAVEIEMINIPAGSFMMGSDDGGEFLWYLGNSGESTHVVGSRRPNPWGLYDMQGNVWEWVQDCYHENYRGAPTDGSPWKTGRCDRHVLRGGSWYSGPYSDRTDSRFSMWTSFRQGTDVGFRLIQD